MTDGRGSTQDAVKGAGIDSEHMVITLKPPLNNTHHVGVKHTGPHLTEWCVSHGAYKGSSCVIMSSWISVVMTLVLHKLSRT